MNVTDLKIYVDDREKNVGILAILRKMDVPIVIARLQVGDYTIGRETGIERKSVNDFINSIIDKRLFEQARYMHEVYKKCIFLIEGDFEKVLRYRKIKYNHIYGALISLMEMNIQLMFTKNYEQSALFLYTLFNRYKKEKRSSYLSPVKIRVIKNNISLRNIQLNLIASLPGISMDFAEKILMYFRTPRKFFRATPDELRRIKGLGDKRIKKIIEVLDTVYQPEIDKLLKE